jgi:hypothetical protein
MAAFPLDVASRQRSQTIDRSPVNSPLRAYLAMASGRSLTFQCGWDDAIGNQSTYCMSAGSSFVAADGFFCPPASRNDDDFAPDASRQTLGFRLQAFLPSMWERVGSAGMIG